MRNPEQIKQFEVSFNGRFIHVRLADGFDIDEESLRLIWMATVTACQENKCSLVLSEGKIRSRQLRTSDAYDSGTTASDIRGLRHALLFYGYEPDELSDFFKMVAENRGVAIEFFTNRAAALEWLGVKDEDISSD